MQLPRWLESALGVCQRRKPPVEEDVTPFWELPSKPSVEVEEEKPDQSFEQANHLKDEGKDKFAKGETNEAMEHWVHALDALCAPPKPAEDGEEGAPAPPPVNPFKPPVLSDDPKVKELRISLLLNLALGHKKLKQWRYEISYCDEALHDEPANKKALFLKADALGELCSWKEAEETVAKLEEIGDEGKVFARQKRQEWRTRRKAADAKEKKMWSGALADAKAAPAPPEPAEPIIDATATVDPAVALEIKKLKATLAALKGMAKELQDADLILATQKKLDQKLLLVSSASTPQPPEAEPAKAQVLEKWVLPKVSQMSVFDLRRKGVEWDESEDFSDAVWKDGLGRREALYYQQRALPLTLLSGAVLAEIDFQSEVIVHCLLDGNTAPFAQPHDWASFLRRVPHVKTLTIVYIDIGLVGEDPSGAPIMPYGTLLRPTEEGRVGDRVARAARFLGTYKEFLGHCRELPGLVVPHIALWADVALYGFNDEDLGIRLEAYKLLTAAGVPSVFTYGGEIAEPGGPQIVPRVEDSGSLSLAILGVGLRPRMMASWHWNRFVVPLDRGEHGILAAHALIGVAKAGKLAVDKLPSAATIKKAMKDRGMAVAPCKLPKAPMARDMAAEKLKRAQWEAFCRKMKEAGRPSGPNVSLEERNRQAMEFYQFCGAGEGLGGGA